jgi:hypothetical protein
VPGVRDVAREDFRRRAGLAHGAGRSVEPVGAAGDQRQPRALAGQPSRDREAECHCWRR